MPPQFLLIALGTLASEDLTCIAAGVLIAQGKMGLAAGILACLTGIVSGDIFLFLAGRLLGRPALNSRCISRFVSAEKVDQASIWLSQRGLAAVFISRFTPGLRLATYFAAGALRTRFWSFATYFLAASLVWVPLLVGGTILFGKQVHGAVAFSAIGPVALLFTFTRRRKLIGFLKRKIQWEFWPPWAAYIPLIPYFVYLAVRHRSLTVFTAANPGIPSGGLIGESKSGILARLTDIADFELIPRGHAPMHALEFPVVLKPDVGERGRGVAVIRSQAELCSYLKRAECDTILQRYVPGLEFGVFYYRYPHEQHGRIFSITEKRFPEVIGDGQTSIENLILWDSRAVCMAAAYARAIKRPLSDVPAIGERVQLVELGSHCRGAIFLDGIRHKTPALEMAIDRVSQSHSGFYFGRFDLRTPSIEAFEQGVFAVIELNGVSAEATHIYDPSITLIEAYRVMFEQWRIAFEIGAANRALGARPMSLSEVVKLISSPSISQHPVPALAAR